MLKILIADDHAIVRKGLTQIIHDEFPSATVQEAGNGEEVISMLMKSDFDVVVCDISMPGRSGIDVLQDIKQIKPQTPVLIMSMHSEDQYAIRVFKAGASGYLNKDTVHEDLINAIQAIRIGRKFITPSIAEKLANSLKGDAGRKSHETLSDREFDVFKLLSSGKSVSEIADKLSLSPTTVSTYRSRILEKMSLRNNADMTRYAITHGLI